MGTDSQRWKGFWAGKNGFGLEQVVDWKVVVAAAAAAAAAAGSILLKKLRPRRVTALSLGSVDCPGYPSPDIGWSRPSSTIRR